MDNPSSSKAAATGRRHPQSVAVIGGGPAGLMAAEALIGGGLRVDLLDAMPSVGRKFLLAGKGGMNLTHAEAAEPFLSRYGTRRAQIAPLLEGFGPQALRDWVHGLGIDTFVGSSGRVFPADMKAAPLLRAWLHRLRAAGVNFHMRHRWLGWDDSEDGRIHHFDTPHGNRSIRADAVVLALGGGSWARLGSDGAWVPLLEKQGVAVTPLRPSNCGFDVNWSEYFHTRFAGQPLKAVVASLTDAAGRTDRRQGDLVITGTGVEGGLIYALSAPIRDQIAAAGTAAVQLDLMPGKTLQRLVEEIAHPRGSRSLSSHLQSRAGIAGVKAGLLRELVPKQDFTDPMRLAAAIKALPLQLIAPRPLDEAISSAGGVSFDALDEKLMIRSIPGIFCAGEMLDWEAPTGGYLLTACFASGRSAGQGALAWLESIAERPQP
jgi:uncharacterized flavoprotein (TIGR03862 family)